MRLHAGRAVPARCRHLLPVAPSRRGPSAAAGRLSRHVHPGAGSDASHIASSTRRWQKRGYPPSGRPAGRGGGAARWAQIQGYCTVQGGAIPIGRVDELTTASTRRPTAVQIRQPAPAAFTWQSGRRQPPRGVLTRARDMARVLLARLDRVDRSCPSQYRRRRWRCERFLSSCGRGPMRGGPRRLLCLRCAATPSARCPGRDRRALALW